MQQPKANTIISRLIIVSIAVLMVIIPITWKVTRDTKARVQQDYDIFQKDLFQQSVFLGRSLSTLKRLIDHGQDPKLHPLTPKEVGACLRAVLGHQEISMQLYGVALERLPEKDPLSIVDQIRRLQSRMQPHIGHLLWLHGQLDEVPDTAAMQALIVASTPKLQGFIDLLKDGLDVHSQAESTYFKMLKEGNAKALETISLSLIMLVGLMAAIIALTGVYLVGQRRAKMMLSAAYDDLEIKVQERTRELRDANVDLSKAQRIAHLGFWIYDIRSDSIHWSTELYQIYGWSSQADRRFSYGQLLKMVHPQDRDYHDRITARLKSEGRGTFEYRIIHSDGQVRTVWGQGEATYDENGAPQTLFGVVQDITARRQAEAELEKNRSILEHAEKLAGLGGWEWDIENDQWTTSDNWVRIHGASSAQLTTAELLQFAHPNDIPIIESALEQAVSGAAPYDIEYRIIRGDTGMMRFIKAKGELKTATSGEPLCMFGTAQDITEQKRALAREGQTRKLESIGILAGGVAHDFNNILYMILGNAEIALEEIPDWNPAYGSIEEIREASLRAAGIVKQLLNFSRKSDQNLRPIGATTVITDILKLVRVTIPSTIALEVALPEEEVYILGDPVQITQVFMNICGNASQAMEETGGRLEILVEPVCFSASNPGTHLEATPGDYLRIQIRDNGPGMDQEIIEHIFDPYFTTKEVGKGSGMGLAVVHGIVNAHGASITVDSSPGSGATFTLLFPVIEEKPQAAVATPKEIPGGTERILFVDDELPIRTLVDRHLTTLGYNVTCCSSPTEAMERFQQQPDQFDLVLTDMTMPIMTGAELAQRIRTLQHHIPVVICTGHSELINPEKAKSMGIDGFIMKPIQKAELATTIRMVLEDPHEQK